MDLNLALDTLNDQDEALERVLEVMAPAVRYVANATGNGRFVDLYGHDAGDPGGRRCSARRGDLP